MPTPVGHTLAALSIYAARRAQPRPDWRLIVLLVVAASLPDIDFAFGYLVGEPRRFHWGPTHSFAAAAAFGVAVAAVTRGRPGLAEAGFLTGLVYASHIVLDMLIGPGVARGIQALWPFTTERFMLPWTVFGMFPAAIEDSGPIGALFSRAALPLIAREILILAPICLVAALYGRYSRRTAA